MTREQTSYLADWIYWEASIEEKSLPWLELIDKAGMKLSKEISPQTVQRAMQADEGYSTYCASIQEYVPPSRRKERKDFAYEILYYHPNYKFWRLFRFCDEIHFGKGKPKRRRIKRRVGERDHDQNTQHAKPEKVAPDQKGSIHFFVLIGYNYIKAIPYKVAASNGKMDAKTYKDILYQIRSDLDGYILYEDQDSAHTADTTTA